MCFFDFVLITEGGGSLLITNKTGDFRSVLFQCVHLESREEMKGKVQHDTVAKTKNQRNL